MSDYMPSDFFGGMASEETLNASAFKTTESYLKACWRVYQESTIRLDARAMRSPIGFGGTDINAHVLLHCQRSQAEQMPPYLNRNYLHVQRGGCP
jgi:hypothetical protein